MAPRLLGSLRAGESSVPAAFACAFVQITLAILDFHRGPDQLRPRADNL